MWVFWNNHWRIKRPANAGSHWRAICFSGAALVATTFAVLKQPPRTITNFHWITSFLNWANSSGQLFGKDRSDPGLIVDRRRRYNAVQPSLLHGEEFSTSQPRPSFETRPARRTPHTLIVASSADPSQAPNTLGELSPELREYRDGVSASESRQNRLGRRPRRSHIGIFSPLTVRSFAVRITFFRLCNSIAWVNQAVVLQRYRSTGYNLKNGITGQSGLVVLGCVRQTVRPAGLLCRSAARCSSLDRRSLPQ